MSIFARANLNNGVTIDVPIDGTNTFTRCCCCGNPIQLSLDRVVEHYDNAPQEYKSFTDYFRNGFICEACAEKDEEV